MRSSNNALIKGRGALEMGFPIEVFFNAKVCRAVMKCCRLDEGFSKISSSPSSVGKIVRPRVVVCETRQTMRGRNFDEGKIGIKIGLIGE